MPTILSRMLSTLVAAAQTADRIDYWNPSACDSGNVLFGAPVFP
jgi:hypothetical protein